MSETQLPRWEVFKQDSPKKVHQAVGTVHASDPEHALFTARNVFGRRPNTISMWVAQAKHIYSVTLEEIESFVPFEPKAGESELYLVFSKRKHSQGMTFVDYLAEVEAVSFEDALQKSMTRWGQSLVWWIVLKSDLYSTEADDADSWFAPAKDKTYKQQSAYGKVKAVRKLEDQNEKVDS